ncbi:MAG: 50S ribosomal protein L29 [Candidatus Jorgensenbacteria bacterium GW2011_GWA2_45_13]|uniref:Large ribosomal subunit protein uL29 n=1 Tax=Candidatus Jorgensenbacteria bacterium GW2011_GWA2_45_13 TaxID=1618662 RepID=A0A0G1L541_9BACT|nr:MAG: 50S ribosomal protein L29 [Candidatus Jorgensenbacteria bacterium GW2011_GWA2_45_13]
MKKVPLKEFRARPKIELEKELSTLRERMMHLRLLIATGKVKNLKEMKEVKRSIAQVETLLRDRRDIPEGE